MEFYTDWMEPEGVDRRTGEAESYGARRTEIKTRRFVELPAHVRQPGGPGCADVIINDSTMPFACGRGIHRRFKVDARRVKRLRLIVSDEVFEGSRKHRDDSHSNLRSFGAPPKLCAAKTVYWAVETEE